MPAPSLDSLYIPGRRPAVLELRPEPLDLLVRIASLPHSSSPPVRPCASPSSRVVLVCVRGSIGLISSHFFSLSLSLLDPASASENAGRSLQTPRKSPRRRLRGQSTSAQPLYCLRHGRSSGRPGIRDGSLVAPSLPMASLPAHRSPQGVPAPRRQTITIIIIITT